MQLRKRRIGSLEVTVVGVGCNNFGRPLDLGQVRRIVDTALDAGLNFFDTADHYGQPRTASESLLGEALGARRHEAVIATKFGRALDEHRRGAKAAYVKAATEASLKRLRTDYIDLMQLHIPDPTTPIEETLGAMAELIEEGKVREVGASNFTAAQIAEANAAALHPGKARFASTQAEYSILQRNVEADLLGQCRHSNVALLPFLPLYNGLLTGRYRAGHPAPQGSRIASKDDKTQAAIFSSRNMEIVAKLTAYAEERGHTVLELAFAWLLAHPEVPAVIAGVSSPQQVTSNIAAAQWELTPAQVAEVEIIAPLDPSQSPYRN